jgi:hypothetical protein
MRIGEQGLDLLDGREDRVNVFLAIPDATTDKYFGHC